MRWGALSQVVLYFCLLSPANASNVNDEYLGSWRYLSVEGRIQTLRLLPSRVELTAQKPAEDSPFQIRAGYRVINDDAEKGLELMVSAHTIEKSGWPVQSMPYFSFDILESIPVMFVLHRQKNGLKVCMRGEHLGGKVETQCAIYTRPSRSGK